MKHFIYNLVFFFTVIFLLLLFILYFNTPQNVEEFTPYFRKLYRPHIRNARIVGEGFYMDNKIHITNVFRKFGIM
jgi:hypothetical protein